MSKHSMNISNLFTIQKFKKTKIWMRNHLDFGARLFDIPMNLLENKNRHRYCLILLYHNLKSKLKII